ncbi:MAG: hypothetical protein ACI9EH_001552 [Planktomarina sp.]|jgi:hypothetical protein|tara:strand:- start:404 stop:745 length:342 start_codon:yes stop_codon:yes gene_type:complete
MDLNKSDETSKFSPLGKMLSWFTKTKNANNIFLGLALLCFLLFLADFTYHKHGHFHIEEIPGFYGAYGFFMFTALILVAKALRLLIKRPENYYGDKAIDGEDYPADQLEQGSK